MSRLVGSERVRFASEVRSPKLAGGKIGKNQKERVRALRQEKRIY